MVSMFYMQKQAGLRERKLVKGTKSNKLGRPTVFVGRKVYKSILIKGLNINNSTYSLQSLKGSSVDNDQEVNKQCSRQKWLTIMQDSWPKRALKLGISELERISEIINSNLSSLGFEEHGGPDRLSAKSKDTK